jgi:hypothetical protein
MALIRKKRIWWAQAEGAAEYVVYCSKDAADLESHNFQWESTPGLVNKVVRGKTELILPDEWKDFPSDPGEYHLAITARDEAGNESDPFLCQGFFKFTAPPAPAKAGIESH